MTELIRSARATKLGTPVPQKSGSMRSSLPHQLPYRADVDGLRAFAIASVVLFHVLPQRLPGGFIGVDIFFVISGFLISSLILDSVRKGSFSFLDFYSRRARRILPSLIVVLCAVFAAGWLLLLPQEFSDLNRMILSSVFFVPNFQLWTEAGYFAGNPNSRPLLHLWSLGVEEQFYLVWPVLILLFAKRGLPWIIAGAAAISFLASMVLLSRYPSTVFYFPLTRFWELMGGAILAWRERRHLNTALGAVVDAPRWLREGFSLSGAALLLAGIFGMNSTMPFPGAWALVPVIGTMLLVGAGAQTILGHYILSNRAVVFLGLISYPLYLWHWPILVFMRFQKLGEPSHHAREIAMVLILLLAWLTYQFIEFPIRKRQPGRARRMILVTLAGGLGLVSLVSMGAMAAGGFPGRFPHDVRSFLTYRYDVTPGWHVQCFLHPSQLPSDWKESTCVDPPTNPPAPLIILWGDSQATQLRPGLDMLAKTRKFRLGQMTGAGCPPFIGEDIAKLPFCRGENDLFLAEIVRLKPDAVVLAAWWVEFGYRPAARTIRLLKQAGIKHIIVMGPPPNWPTHLPTLLIRNAVLLHHLLPMTLGPDMIAPVPENGLKSLTEKEGATFISEWDMLCPSGQCITMTSYGPKFVTFFDASHLSEAGSRFLVGRVGPSILKGVDAAPR